MDEIKFRERYRYRGTYHTFTVEHRGHTPIEVEDFMFRVREWCEYQFHHNVSDPVRFKILGWSVRVISETDAFHFKLRWC